jgi:NADH dehydrogenase
LTTNNLIKIVILGAGYAGIFLAIDVYQTFEERGTGDRNRKRKGKDSPPSNVEVILVDRNPYHQLLQEIHLVAAGYRTQEEISIPITSLINGTKIRFIQSNVKVIAANDNKIVLDRSAIDYDLAVVCLGSSTKYFGIKGAKTNTIPFRSIDDAIFVHDKIQSFLSSKSSERGNVTNQSNGNNIKITIVGGGATGVSLSGAIADFIKDQGRLRENSETNLSITVVEALPNILTGWNSELVSRVKAILESKGIRILTNSKVSKVENNNLILYDGSKIESSIIIWTAGIKGYEIEVSPPIDKTKDGRIIVNRFCQVDKFPNIFVIGDIAAVKDSQGKIYPPFAQIAVREARYLADMLAKHYLKLNDKNSNFKSSIMLKGIDMFDYNIGVQIISLGVNDYVGVFGNHVIGGNLAKMVDEFGKLAYVKTLKSRGKDISSVIYDDGLLPKMIAGFSFAGFAFAKWK